MQGRETALQILNDVLRNRADWGNPQVKTDHQKGEVTAAEKETAQVNTPCLTGFSGYQFVSQLNSPGHLIHALIL